MAVLFFFCWTLFLTSIRFSKKLVYGIFVFFIYCDWRNLFPVVKDLIHKVIPGGPKVGVSNERFSVKVKLVCKLDIHTALLSPPVYLRRRVGLQCFQGVTQRFRMF